LTGRELRKQRLLLGLTQNELAMKLGVARNTVCRWELGFLPAVPKYVPLAMKGLSAEVGVTGRRLVRRQS
jgi:transcriptional regulator with XRE-family HTH domain